MPNYRSEAEEEENLAYVLWKFAGSQCQFWHAGKEKNPGHWVTLPRLAVVWYVVEKKVSEIISAPKFNFPWKAEWFAGSQF
jgi:hypothetical protein